MCGDRSGADNTQLLFLPAIPGLLMCPCCILARTPCVQLVSHQSERNFVYLPALPMSPSHTVPQQVSDTTLGGEPADEECLVMNAKSSYSPCSLTKAKILLGFGHFVVRMAVEKEHSTLNFIYEALALITFCGFWLWLAALIWTTQLMLCGGLDWTTKPWDHHTNHVMMEMLSLSFSCRSLSKGNPRMELEDGAVDIRYSRGNIPLQVLLTFI